MGSQDISMAKIFIHIKLEEYLHKNPERYTTAEKNKLYSDVFHWLESDEKWIADGVEDFLVYAGIYKHDSREKVFADYIKAKYKPTKYKRVLDVGAGRMCRSTILLSNYGYKASAIDPAIRLDAKESKAKGITIYKRPFLCDEYARGGKGTEIRNVDLVVGLEPCDATEHIIRQSLKYEKPFDVTLCYSEHNGLDGSKYATPEEWYDHLQRVSGDVEIVKVGSMYHARAKDMEL